MSAYPNPRALTAIQADIAAGNNISEPQIFIDLLVAVTASLSATGRTLVEPLGQAGTSLTVAAASTSAEVALTETCRRVSLTAVGADLCFRIGAGTIGNAVATDHYLVAGTTKDFAVAANSKIAAIRAGSTDGSLRITELIPA